MAFRSEDARNAEENPKAFCYYTKFKCVMRKPVKLNKVSKEGSLKLISSMQICWCSFSKVFTYLTVKIHLPVLINFRQYQLRYQASRLPPRISTNTWLRYIGSNWSAPIGFVHLSWKRLLLYWHYLKPYVLRDRNWKNGYQGIGRLKYLHWVIVGALRTWFLTANFLASPRCH